MTLSNKEYVTDFYLTSIEFVQECLELSWRKKAEEELIRTNNV